MKIFHTPSVKIGLVLSVFILFCIAWSCKRPGEEKKEETAAYRMPDHHAFVGDQTCQTCHSREWDDWIGSHHDRAMAKASEETVHGDFSDVVFEDGDDIYRFYREDERYMVEAPGPDGEPAVYEIIYTFGWEPLQQYLVEFGRGKLQALHIAWDTERNEWFSLYPGEQLATDDWLHWTRGAMNWNTMCAECHSTNLRINYIAEADSFHTEWSAINVSCEACHGPGRDHVEFMGSEESEEAGIERIRADLNLTRASSQLEEINTCAPCHGLRQKLTGFYHHGDELMDHYNPLLPDPSNYFPDGQLKEEAFELGSFLQSKMYQEGVRCTDCHNPHTARLRANVVDNTLCMQCHEPRYNTPEHHFHKINTKAAQCISCHMTGLYFMEVDYRRDHSFRVPRPDLSATFGTPNACNDCHSDQTPEWASQAIVEWYGEKREYHFSETLLKADAEGENAAEDLRQLYADTGQPEIVRALALWHLARYPDRQNFETLRTALDSESAMIRSSAANALDSYPAEMKSEVLTGALDDEIRAVRIAAARSLAELQITAIDRFARDHFEQALQEYRDYLDINQYFPQGQMNLGQFFEKRNEIDKAIEAYHTVLEKDHYFTPARMNLSFLYNSRGENAKAEELLQTVIDQDPDYGQAYYSMALLLSEQNKLSEAIPYFENAAGRMPDHSRVFYNLAIAYQTLGNPSEAESAYLRALNLEPENAAYRYGIVTLYLQQEQYNQALEHAEILNRLQPNDPQVQQLLQMIRRQL